MMRTTQWRMLIITVFAGQMAAAATGIASDEESGAVHAQFTYVEQETSGFNAPYAGPNSLSPDRGAETIDATLYLGARLWPGAEGWINGEIDQGFGLDNTLGVAGFPSGEDYKIGKNQPYLRLPRAFVRQTLNLNDTGQAVDAAANQLGGSRSADRVVITVGKFIVGDVFDTNYCRERLARIRDGDHGFRFVHQYHFGMSDFKDTVIGNMNPRMPGVTRRAPPSSGTRVHGRCAGDCSICPPCRTVRISIRDFMSFSPSSNWKNAMRSPATRVVCSSRSSTPAAVWDCSMTPYNSPRAPGPR